MQIVRDWGREAQQAAEDHLDALDEALGLQEDGASIDWSAYDAAAPYCGCRTCTVRETLHAAWPVLKIAFGEGVE